MSHEMKFSASTFPLLGHRLIEASAGTGKTYNIANLYLRLVVGDDCVAKSVDQILVVTFTRAATNELRGRIREKVEQALHAFRGEPCKDEFIQNLLLQMDEKRAECARLLNSALLRMDEACIFTIHGFAVRAIQTFLFETGALADVEILEAGNARKELLLNDLWRQFHMSPNEAIASYVAVMGFKNASGFHKYFQKKIDQADINPVFNIDAVSKLEKAPDFSGLLVQVDDYVSQIIEPILIERAELLAVWTGLCHSRGESAIRSALGDSGNSKLFEKIDLIVRSTEGKVAFPSGKMLERMQAMCDSGSQDALPVFIRRLSQHISSGIGHDVCQRNGFRSLVWQYIQARMAEHDLSMMQLDEVVSLISTILQQGDARAAQLRNVITQAYPVCMVDEFQDTDPAQFEMFNLLYSSNQQTGFFMIGDPKQSIYQFRGADIFSYLAVRHSVKQLEESTGDQRIFTLDTNYRSKSALVAATNLLFKDGEQATFLYPGIDYVHVNSCEDQSEAANKGGFSVRNKQLSSSPLVFVGNDSNVEGNEKFNGDTLRWKFAKDTAQRIALLMNANQGGVIHRAGKTPSPVVGGDIAVLVRTGREAAVVREALLAQTPPVGSVFQSQNDSVFKSSCLGEDIYHLLNAMDDPGNKGLLKKVMVTPLYRGFALDFQALDIMNSDDGGDEFFEQSIAEFSEYRRYWDDYGVLAAINHFAQQRGVMQKLALLPDCDRLVTDLRHLGELLQAKSQECSSREQLILWFGRQLGDDSELDENSKRIRLESDDNLVKIVTIHVSKGLEYPIVFLPFFFMPWQSDADAALPLYHPEPDYRPFVNFSADVAETNSVMQKEMLAEDMRLLYVAITRAIFQCHIGISPATHYKKALFPLTCWAHLLGLQEEQMPAWSVISASLQARFGQKNTAIDYRVLFDAKKSHRDSVGHVSESHDSVALVSQIDVPVLPVSNWIITSYSALAHARKDPGQQRGGYDETLVPVVLDADDNSIVEDDKKWQSNIRYRLPGGTHTGDCLHKFFEELAKLPSGIDEVFSGNSGILRDCLRRYQLDKPEGVNASFLSDEKKQAQQAEWHQQIAGWMQDVLNAPLLAGSGVPALIDLLVQSSALPELSFDMALGENGPVRILEGINAALRQSGLSGVTVPRRSELEGVLTGSIDLLFIHDKKVYVLDYKSNTLGRAPRFYDRQSMQRAMEENRYDLQYLIYSVAAHRYMQQRLADRYSYDGGEYSFGGVFYLFLRGMGLAEYPDQGVFFERPAIENIAALDAALSGQEVSRG